MSDGSKHERKYVPNHTPEPWQVEEGDGEVLVVDITGAVVAHMKRGANARRIVAAVNACSGLSNEALEKMKLADVLASCAATQARLEHGLRSAIRKLEGALAEMFREPHAEHGYDEDAVRRELAPLTAALSAADTWAPVSISGTTHRTVWTCQRGRSWDDCKRHHDTEAEAEAHSRRLNDQHGSATPEPEDYAALAETSAKLLERFEDAAKESHAKRCGGGNPDTEIGWGRCDDEICAGDWRVSEDVRKALPNRGVRHAQ